MDVNKSSFLLFVYFKKEMKGNHMYKLLTPGPLTTSETVKNAMLIDHCTWDQEYKEITQWIRKKLLDLAQVSEGIYTTVLMQGSGSFGVESVLSSVIRPEDTVLICSNGAYGQRMINMCECLKLNYTVYEVSEHQILQAHVITQLIEENPSISALAMVHSETTSGILNNLEEIAAVTQERDLLFIVDAMSSFGGIPICVAELGIDFLISSSNKCIQGVPGFSFVLANKAELEKRKNVSRSLSLDLYDQYRVMENENGKWRFTSPTHTVLAFQQALKELEAEGGIETRYSRYLANNHVLRQKMTEMGFQPFIQEYQGPFITSFLYPKDWRFDFNHIYQYLKQNGFVIYPGKISDHECFRIGNIGEIYPEDILELTAIIKDYKENVND